MGAWSEDTFGNDDACDWKYDFLEDPGLGIVKATLQTVLDEEDYLDIGDGSNGLAACEVLARMQGRWGLRNAYSEDLDKWVEQNPTEVPQELKDLADAAIARILGPNSEAQELWDEGGRNEAWHNAVDDLRARVRG